MRRNKPWIFLNKSAKLSNSNFELGFWQTNFIQFTHICLVDESTDSFSENNIHTSIARLVNSKDASMFNFLCSFHFGESKFPQNSFEFFKIKDIKRICVIVSDKINESLYREILLGFFDFILVDEVSDHFGVTNVIRNINPFVKIFVYKNSSLDLLDPVNNNYNIIVNSSSKNDVVLKNQIKQLNLNGIECGIECLENYPVHKSSNGWIVLPQMRDNNEIIRKSIILYSSGEKVFVPQEIFDNFHYGIPYKSFREINDLSIYNKSDDKCVFECIAPSDFVIKILSIIHGS